MKDITVKSAYVINAVLPYSIYIALFVSQFVSDFDNLDAALWCFVAFCVLILMLNIAVIARHKELDATKMARAYLIMKLVQIPGYVMNFFFGYTTAVFIITLAVTVGIIILDFIVEVLAFFLMIAVMMSAKDEGRLSKGERILYCFIQLIYCVDIIAAIVAYIRIKNATPQVQAADSTNAAA